MRLAAALTALALLGGCTVAPAPTPSVEPVETTTVSTSAASTVSASASPTPSTSTETASPAGRCAAALVDDMTLRERAGQLVMVGVTTASAAEVKVLKDRKIGSVILMGQHTDGVAGVRKVVARLSWKGQSVPLLVAVDQEGGVVQRLRGKGFDTMPSARV